MGEIVGCELMELYRKSFDIGAVDVMSTSPLALAYIGDCIYDLAAREYVLSHFPGNINRMNQEKKKLVCAGAQAEIMGYLIGRDLLTAEELGVYRRGRNHKSGSHSKNSSIQEYRRATGFEALIGYLYYKEELVRMLELMSMGMKHLLDIERSNNNEG